MKTYINNFEFIEPLLKENMYYHVQILKRKQDGGGQGQFFSKAMYPENLSLAYSDLCRVAVALEARVYINLTPISTVTAAWKVSDLTLDYIKQGNHTAFTKVLDSALGSSPTSNKDLKTWIIDMDGATEDEVEEMNDWVSHLRPVGCKFVAKLKTPNGWHLITRPFDLGAFHNNHSEDVHKNNPTVLFAGVTNE